MWRITRQVTNTRIATSGQACSNRWDDWNDRAKSSHKLTYHPSQWDDGYLLPGEKHLLDLRPKGIVKMLNLLRPIYEKTAAYGHFGRDEPEFSWEGLDKVETLKAAL